MTREIKFRGRSTHSDDWCYGSFVNNPDEPTICGFDIWADGDSDWREEKVEPHTVGQYTGLCDKNGKEIYEGDIVHLDSWSPYAMQICFIEGAFCMTNEKGEYLGDIHFIQHAGINQCTILGNIYDNPELLKGDEK